MMSLRCALPLSIATACAGCATTAAPDPFESVNRKTFAFNQTVDRTVLKPVATAYVDVVPAAARRGVANFFANLTDLRSAANLVLQGRFEAGASDIGRFATNTTVGLLGFMDVAKGLGMERHGETFGRTLTAWGVEPGAYIVWPLLGASTARDSVALPLDASTSLLSAVGSGVVQAGLVGVSTVDQRARALPVTEIVDSVALDPYLYIRDAYLQRSRKAASTPVTSGDRQR